MRNRSKLLLAALGAAVLLAAAVGTASAARLQVSGQSITAVWRAMTFRAPAVGVSVSCPVTLEGTLHSRTIIKTPGSLIGYIARATVGEASCTGGRARTLTARLPWHVQYSSFSGTLPNITSVNTNVIGAEFLIQARVLGTEVSCLYTTSAAEPATGRFELTAGTLTSVTVGGEIRSASGGVCPRGVLGGTSSSVTAITVRLIA